MVRVSSPEAHAVRCRRFELNLMHTSHLTCNKPLLKPSKRQPPPPPPQTTTTSPLHLSRTYICMQNHNTKLATTLCNPLLQLAKRLPPTHPHPHFYPSPTLHPPLSKGIESLVKLSGIITTKPERPVAIRRVVCGGTSGGKKRQGCNHVTCKQTWPPSCFHRWHWQGPGWLGASSDPS